MGLRVAVVGAGYAGLAAAVTLAGRGAQVTVLESGPVPGGRARRITSQGQTMDNGQHILVGAYATLFSLMRTVGVPSDAVLRVPLSPLEFDVDVYDYGWNEVADELAALRAERGTLARLGDECNRFLKPREP